MAGLFGNIGEFFTGGQQDAAQQTQNQLIGNAQQQANVNLNQANQLNNQIARQGNQAYGYGQQGVQQSFGNNAADYLKRMNQAAQGQASQQAGQATTQGLSNALKGARGAGLNRGQAALAAAQQGGNMYAQNYQQGLGQQQAAYGQGANQFAQQQQLGAGMRQNAAGQLGQIGLGSQQAAFGGAQDAVSNAANSASIGGMLFGNALQAGSKALSDENQKTNIESVLGKLKGGSPLDSVLAKIRPVSFNYKEGSGENPQTDRVGILAQDLEQTPFAGNVTETPRGKEIDTNQQTLGNLELIVELGNRLKALEERLK